MQPLHLRYPDTARFDHVELLTFFAKWIKPKHYLELGVKFGTSFIPVAKFCERATGVDIYAPPFALESNSLGKTEYWNNPDLDLWFKIRDEKVEK